MRLVQFVAEGGDRRVGVSSTDGQHVTELAEPRTVYELAQLAIAERSSLAEAVAGVPKLGSSLMRDLLDERRILAPIDHPDPAHLLVTGTGLTHTGSASARDAMHSNSSAGELTDSMRMFRSGIDGGKPDRLPGVAPEWFFKGDGSSVVAPGRPLDRPAFAEDGGEEAEVVGIYVVDSDGEPCRVGYAIGNEFSDHVLERRNYLYLAHSKLRPCSFGPELRMGDLPNDIRGTIEVTRNGDTLWKSEFISGEHNMCHSLANLEHHHFKYAMFTRPGDVHVHFFGAANLSCVDDVAIADGDRIRIDVPVFGAPLENPVEWMRPAHPVEVRSL